MNKPPEVCDCIAFCQHDGKPPGGVMCRARDNWYKAPCKEAKCTPGDCWGCRNPAEIPDEE